MQQSNQALEQRYQEDQQKWGKLSERVSKQMEEHSSIYQNKFPIDPFRRDNIFQESALLTQELTASCQTQMQRKQQFNIKNKLSQQNQPAIEDFNVLNVIKTDYKTQQRQKEIINVISDMSAQISQILAKCMQSFIS